MCHVYHIDPRCKRPRSNWSVPAVENFTDRKIGGALAIPLYMECVWDQVVLLYALLYGVTYIGQRCSMFKLHTKVELTCLRHSWVQTFDKKPYEEMIHYMYPVHCLNIQ